MKTDEPYNKAPVVDYREVHGQRVNRPRKCYQPMIHRTTSFAFFLILTLGLIGIVEYACRTLPHGGWTDTAALAKSILHSRQDSTTNGTKGTIDPGSGNPNAYLNSDTVSQTLATLSSAYLDSQTTPLAASTNTDNILPSEAASQSAYLNPTIDASSNPNAYLNPTTTSVDGSIKASSTNVVASSDSSAYLNPMTTTGATPTTSVPMVTSVITSGPNEDLTRVTKGTSGVTTTMSSSPTITSPADQGFDTNSTGKHPPLKNLTRVKYFLGAYVPTFVAVLFRISIGWLYAATKLLEPFFTLTQAEGATAGDFFHINFLSTNDSLDPFKAMFSGHWLMLWTSVLYTVVGLMTPFASELLRFANYCDDNNTCGPELRVNLAVANILQGLLAFSAVMLISVWWLQRKHSSGIYSDPSSIASLASLLHNPEVVADFQKIRPGASKDEMLEATAGRRYRLDTYQALNGSERYGLVIHGGTTYDQEKAHEPFLTSSTSEDAFHSASHETNKKRHSIKRIIRDAVFGLVTVGILIIVAYYYKTGYNSGFERFMDSQSFGPRFLFSTVGILIHSQWKRLERETAIMEPFRRLQAGNASAQSSILFECTLSPLTTFFTSIFRSDFFVAHVAFVAILAEALIIVLSGIPFSAGQLHSAFILSAYLGMTILAYMLISLMVMWFRPSGPYLPRTPNTLAAIWSYLCGARMIEDFADLACTEAKNRDSIIKDLGMTYVLGIGRGTDGVMRWGVDYDSHEL